MVQKATGPYQLPFVQDYHYAALFVFSGFEMHFQQSVDFGCKDFDQLFIHELVLIRNIEYLNGRQIQTGIEFPNLGFVIAFHNQCDVSPIKVTFRDFSVALRA